MTPEEAVAKARESDKRQGGEYFYRATRRGEIVVRVYYKESKHIGEQDGTFFFDENTGELTRILGGK